MASVAEIEPVTSPEEPTVTRDELAEVADEMARRAARIHDSQPRMSFKDMVTLIYSAVVKREKDRDIPL